MTSQKTIEVPREGVVRSMCYAALDTFRLLHSYCLKFWAMVSFLILNKEQRMVYSRFSQYNLVSPILCVYGQDYHRYLLLFLLFFTSRYKFAFWLYQIKFKYKQVQTQTCQKFINCQLIAKKNDQVSNIMTAPLLDIWQVFRREATARLVSDAMSFFLLCFRLHFV